MNKDNNIEINITHGKLESFSVHLGDKLHISATLGLYTDAENKVSSFSVDTRNYYGETKIDLPIGTIPAIQKIAEEIELAVVRKCREGQLALAEKNNE